MLKPTIRLLVVLAVTIQCFVSPVLSFAAKGTFDAPLKKNVVDFGRSEYSSNSRIKLSCYFYRTFVVKEYDDSGKKGAVWLAIAPIEGQGSPMCTREHVSGERVIDWSGGFWGAKENLVFLCGAGGQDGAMPFAVYDSKTGRKLFQDLAYDSSFVNRHLPDSPFNRLRVRGALDGWSLKYLRVFASDCDLHKDRTPCWEEVKAKLHMKNNSEPECTGYKGIPTRWPSAVAYPVEASLFPEPTINTIAGPVSCWPVD